MFERLKDRAFIGQRILVKIVVSDDLRLGAYQYYIPVIRQNFALNVGPQVRD